MQTEQHRLRIHTIDLPGRRRWLIWGERESEFHLQSLAARGGNGTADLTMCGRRIEPESRSVIAPDASICRECVAAALNSRPVRSD